MSISPEKRIRRTDLWVGLLFTVAILFLGLIDIQMERASRNAYRQDMKRLEHVILGHAYKPLDGEFLELLETQDQQVDRLLEITRQQAIVAQAIKKRQDGRGHRIGKVENDVQNLKSELKKSKKQEPPVQPAPVKPAKRHKGFFGGKP